MKAMLLDHTFRKLAGFTLAAALLAAVSTAAAFEGRIQATLTRGGQSAALLYTAGTNCLRVENTATNWPNPVNLLARSSGALTLLFPNNRSFVRLPPVAENSSTAPPGFPPMSGGLPPAGGPMMPPPMMEKIELRATGEKTNLLGYACEQYEIQQHGETMKIWATDQLFPFQPYLQNQPHRFGPRLIEEQWSELVKARKLFPLLATLRFANGAELFRFEVQAVTPQKMTAEDAGLFQPPPGYFEIQPLPF